MKLVVLKKDGTTQDYNRCKIISACSKASERAGVKLVCEDYDTICKTVEEHIENLKLKEISVSELHSVVESVLLEKYNNVGKQYQQYRNYKLDFVSMLDDVYKKSQEIRYIGDISNANSDSSMVSTQRSLIYGELNKSLYQKFFLNKDELQACNDGYIYVHDMKDRLDSINCFRRDTRFITSEGIKSFYDYSDGDKVEVISHKGIWRNAVVRKLGRQPIQEVVMSKSTKTGKEVSVFCTKDHRWILKDGNETTDLKIGNKLFKVGEITDFNWDDLGLKNKKLWCKEFVSGDSEWCVKDIKVSDLNTKAEVWCLEVEVDHSFLLDYGIPTGNCQLFDMSNVLRGGFEMGNVWYNEPKTLDVAFDVISDVAMSASSQSYGGFTIPRVDNILLPYAQKSFDKYYEEYLGISHTLYSGVEHSTVSNLAKKYAYEKTYRDMEQGFQSWEYRFNTVGSSRGDYPFLSISFGLEQSELGKMLNKACLEVRRKGQGKDGFKKAVLFPKLTFIYDEKLHGEGKPLEDVFEVALDCSASCMYPDYLSVSGEGYIPSMYKKYKEVVSLMGKCKLAHVKSI